MTEPVDPQRTNLVYLVVSDGFGDFVVAMTNKRLLENGGAEESKVSFRELHLPSNS